VPKNWRIDSQWEKGINLPDDRISYISFSRKEGYMVLNISKLYSHTSEYQCEPKDNDIQTLSTITIDGYKTYQSYSIMNVDIDYKETTFL